MYFESAPTTAVLELELKSQSLLEPIIARRALSLTRRGTRSYRPRSRPVTCWCVACNSYQVLIDHPVHIRATYVFETSIDDHSYTSARRTYLRPQLMTTKLTVRVLEATVREPTYTAQATCCCYVTRGAIWCCVYLRIRVAAYVHKTTPLPSIDCWLLITDYLAGV